MIDQSGQSEEIQTILAQANLSRMRGDWDEAVEACMDALCNDPRCVGAHSLLGDIHADQGRLDDAIQWYCAALDIKPNSHADRAKLLRAVEDRKRHMSETPRQLSGALNHITSTFTVKSTNRLTGTDRAVKTVIFLVALLMLSAIVAAPLVVQYRKQSAQGFSYKTTNSTQIIETPPVILGNHPNVSVPSTAPPPTMPVMTGYYPSDPFDQTLLAHLRANPDMSSHGIEVVAVESDPRTAHVVLTFVNASLSQPSSAVHGIISRNALRLAQAAFKDAQPNHINALTLRALYAIPDPGASGGAQSAASASASRLTFMADISTSDLTDINVNDSGMTDSDAENRFTAVWWSGALQ